MLETLRNAAGTWVAKALLALLVVSFAVWGISGSIFGGLGNSVVTAGNTTVSVLEYRLAYDRQLSILSQQFGTRITREQAQALGIDAQVLAQVVAGAVLDEQARKMGLGLSKEKLAQLTFEDPAFQGPDGRFNRQQFEFVLRQVGMRPEDYLKNREQVAIRQQIVEAVSDGLSAPDTFLRAVALYRGEDRTVEYVTLPRSLVEPVEEPDQEKLESFFDERKSSYGAPEYRKFAYVKLEPEDIADPSAILDDQVRAYYEKNVARYTTAESRTIQQIVFADEEAAKAAAEKIKAGSTFEEIVAEQGKTVADTTLGTFTKDRVGDPAIAEAAFALEENGVSGVVAGRFGPVIIRVTQITPETVKPLDEVKDTIRNELALDEASRILFDVHDSYEDARAGGATLAEAASKLKLDVKTVEAIDRSGQTPDGTIVSDLPQSAELIRNVFETEAGIENPAINIGASGFLFYEVEGITPARERGLDEVREKVIADWKDTEAQERLSALAEKHRKALADGAAFTDVATELGLDVQTKRGLKRDADDADFGKTGVVAVFGVAKDQAGVVTAPDETSQVLFKVTEVFEPVGAGPDSLDEAARNNFASGLSDDLLDQLVAKLQTEYSVTIDQAAIRQALSF